jgi:hypothetical protein
VVVRLFVALQAQLALAKHDAYALAHGHVSRTAHDAVALVEDDGVAALKRCQRAHGVKRAALLLHAQAVAFDAAFHASRHALAQFANAQADRGKAQAWMLRGKPGLQAIEPGAAQGVGLRGRGV